MILLQTWKIWSALAFCAAVSSAAVASASAQDHVETNVELIPDVVDDEEGHAPRATPHHHQHHHVTAGAQTNRSPDQTELQQVLQFIEEKFLSFAALNVRPNFANVLRHMERIVRAFVKLSTRVDSVHAQLEDMSNHQTNCSTQHQISALVDTVTTRLNELDRKIDHLERQVQYPPSYGFTKNLENMSGQLRHIQESLELMEKTNVHFTSGALRNSQTQQHMSTDFHTVLAKMDDMRQTLGEVASATNTDKAELQLNTILTQGIDRKLDDLGQIILQQHHLRNFTQANTAADASSHFAAIVEQQHNETHKLLLQLAERQDTVPGVQRQLEKIPDLLKIVQDLPGVTTDAMDRAEVMFTRIQDKIEGIHIHVSANHQTLSKLETHFEDVVEKIDQLAEDAKDSVDNTNIHDTMLRTQPATSHSQSLPKNHSHTTNNAHLLSSSDAGTLVTLMQKVDLKVKDLHAICQPKCEHEGDTFTKLKEHIDKTLHTHHHSGQETDQNESSFLASTMQRLDQTSNNTQDKLDYITSSMATFQVDHSLLTFSLEEVMRQMGKLQQKADEVLQETETLKLAMKQNGSNKTLPSAEDRSMGNNSHQLMLSEKIHDILLHAKAKIDDLHHIRHEKKCVTNHHENQTTSTKQDNTDITESAVVHTEETKISEDVDSTYYEAVIKHLMQLQAIVDKLSTAMSETNPSYAACSPKDWDVKIEQILTHHKHNFDRLLKHIPEANGTNAIITSALTKIGDDLISLATNGELDLQETRKISERIDTLHVKVDLINNDSLGRVMRLIEVGERSKNGSGNWELTTTAMLQTIYDRVAEVDKDASQIQMTIQSGMDTLLERMKLVVANATTNLHKFHPARRLSTDLAQHETTNDTTNDHMTGDHTTDTQDFDDVSWQGTPDLTYLLQSVMDDKLDKMKINIQNIIDNGVFQFVDFIGQQKLMVQQSMTTFVHQQNENMAKMMETLATRISKGFEDVHFMYQLISGKMDKMYHIAAHNLEDCADIQKSGHTQSGVYTIYPRNSKELRVFCDMETEGGGWTVIQRRGDYGEHHRTSFNQTWIDYKYGFGHLEREFWMGNENIHILTSQGNYILRIELLYADPDPKLPRHRRKIWHNLKNTSRLYAQYYHFHVKSENHNYTMTHKGYKGIHPHDGFEGRSGHAFTTWDHAADVNLEHCAKIQGGGWWYGVECFRFALNSKHKRHYWEDGNLFTGITWGGPADIALLKHVEMKILPHLARKRQSRHIPPGQ